MENTSPPSPALARIVSWNDQQAFADATGDINPLHMDALAARRTQAGAPVVHGVHSLLWLLDVIAAGHPDLPPVTALKCRFSRMVFVGDEVEARITNVDPAGFSAQVTAGGLTAVQVKGTLGELRPPAAPPWDNPATPRIRPTIPIERSMDEIADQTGRIAFTADDRLPGRFPHAARWLGARRVAALGCSSYLVGMVMPGLHSLYGGLSIDCREDATPSDHIAFRVASADSRFRMATVEMAGGGLSGTLDTFLRLPPTTQASCALVSGLVSRSEFPGARVLVVGGSRGLGELTAKIIAAGGGHATITYSVGEADARAVADEIRTAGGLCDVMRYDALQDADRQLADARRDFTHLYYFATPNLFGRGGGPYAHAQFERFTAFFVSGFHRLVDAALRRQPEGFGVFYPSTVAIDDRPANMTEYTMAKAAGEILCADLARQMRSLRIFLSRLPRLPTDQTATLQQVATEDPLRVMSAIVRNVQSGSPSGRVAWVPGGPSTL